VQVLLSKPFNLIAFNCMWFGCVAGRDTTLWFVAPLVVSYASLLLYCGKTKFHHLFLPIVIGLCADASLTLVGMFQFSSSGLLVPFWLMVLWLAFSTTLESSLAVIGGYKWVAACAGGLIVPLNYAVAERLGAVSFGQDYLLTLITIGVIWAALLPLFFWIVEENWKHNHAAYS